MQTFFRSGAAFMLVALICVAAGLLSSDRTLFTSIGGFWFVAAIVVRAKTARNPSSGGDA